MILSLLLACATETPRIESEPQAEVVACEDPSDLRVFGMQVSGYEECKNGGRNRVRAQPVPKLHTRCEEAHQEPDWADCDVDADCGEDQYCAFLTVYGFGDPFCACQVNPCVWDSDCGSGACYLGDCVSAGCRSNADCLNGQCGVWEEYEGGDLPPLYGLTCRSPSDECRGGSSIWCDRQFQLDDR